MSKSPDSMDASTTGLICVSASNSTLLRTAVIPALRSPSAQLTVP